MYEIDKVKFGEFVSTLRKEKGITQKELAEKLYISDKAISKWETGHSVPDITLLVPLSEILEVSVAELLECRRIEKEDTLDKEQADKLVKKVIGLSGEEHQSKPKITRKNIFVFVGCALIGFLEWFLLHQMEQAFYFEMYVLLMMGMAFIFGIYFWFFMKEKLPAYYDENRINVYVDGVMHMNMPGVYFNNNNWPYIVKALRIWSLLGMTVAPVGFIVVSSLLGDLRPMSDVFIELAYVLGGLFVPIYVLGRKYECREVDANVAGRHGAGLKGILFIIIFLVVMFGIMSASGGMTTRMATRIQNRESTSRTHWSATYKYCDGYMQRSMRTKEETDRVAIVVETEEGTLSIKIEDKEGNIVYDEQDIQTGTYEVEMSGVYTVRLEMEDHKGSFFIGG